MLSKILGWIVLVGLCIPGVGKAQQPTAGIDPHTRTSDESLRYSLEFAGGYSVSRGVDRITQTRAWDFLAGAGVNLNRHIGFLAEYTFDRFAVPQGSQSLSPPLALGSKEAVHVWSVTGAATYRYFATEHWGGYVVGGYGLFHRAIAESNACGAQPCGPPDTVTFAGQRALGFDVGTGLAMRFSDGSNVKWFVEARYVRTGEYDNSGLPSQAPASEHETFIPVRGGLRW